MKSNTKTTKAEPDSLFFLKLLLYLIIGSIWLQFKTLQVPIPIGLLIGLIFARHEHFQIDRKIEYAILLVAAVLSFIAPVGLVLDVRL